MRIITSLAFVALASSVAVAQQQPTIQQVAAERDGCFFDLGRSTFNANRIFAQAESMQGTINDIPKRIAQETAVLKAENDELKRQLEEAKKK